MTRANKLTIAGALVVGGSIYMIYRSIKKNTIYDELYAKIKSSGVADNQKLNSVLSGTYHTSLNTTKPFAVLDETSKRRIAEQIYNATKGTGTDEESLNDAFNSLKDKVQISQVASYYKAKYNESLLSLLKSELNTTELNQVYSTINSKYDVRWIA